MKIKTSKRKTSVQRPEKRWFLGRCVGIGVKEIILTTSCILFRTLLSEVAFGEGEENVSWEAPVAPVTACSHLYPSNGCHHAGGAALWQGGKGQASRSSVPGPS